MAYAPILLSLVLAGAAGSAAAQVYRIVGPDGKVTFSDRPPATAPVTPPAATDVPATSRGGPALPYELRTTAQRYPVTLYTAADCVPCASARNMLRGRGIPFAEKTVSTPEDGEALKRISGDSSLPFATIGSQHLQGFADAEWAQYLDAAGYPQQSQLPLGYQAPAAAPLVAVQRSAAPSSAAANRAAPAPRAPAAVPGSRAPSNPAGLQF